MPAAGLIETPPVSKQNSLADEGDRGGLLRLARGPAPAHDDDSAVARRTLADAKQCAHAELGHRLFVEHVDRHPKLRETGGAVGELHGEKDVGGLVDEIPGHFDAVGERLAHHRGAARAFNVGDADRDGRGAATVAVFLLLVLFETIGAKPEAEHEIGRGGGAPRAFGRLECDANLFGRADLAEDIAAQRRKIGVRQFLGAAQTDDQQALGPDALRRNNIQSGERLSLELRDFCRARDQPLGAGEKSAGRRPAFEVGADENNIGSSLGRGQRREGGLDEFTHRVLGRRSGDAGIRRTSALLRLDKSRALSRPPKRRREIVQTSSQAHGAEQPGSATESARPGRRLCASACQKSARGLAHRGARRRNRDGSATGSGTAAA